MKKFMTLCLLATLALTSCNSRNETNQLPVMYGPSTDSLLYVKHLSCVQMPKLFTRCDGTSGIRNTQVCINDSTAVHVQVPGKEISPDSLRKIIDDSGVTQTSKSSSLGMFDAIPWNLIGWLLFILGMLLVLYGIYCLLEYMFNHGNRNASPARVMPDPAHVPPAPTSQAAAPAAPAVPAISAVEKGAQPTEQVAKVDQPVVKVENVVEKQSNLTKRTTVTKSTTISTSDTTVTEEFSS